MAEQKVAQDAPTPTFDGGDPAGEENTPEITANGDPVAPGLVVRYTTRLGIVHPATVASSQSQDDGTTRATLDAEIDGRWQRFVGVPHSAVGAINTWDYAPSEVD